MNSRQFDRGVSLLDVNGATLQFVERWEGTNFSHCFCRRRTRDYFGMINTLLVGGRGAIGAGLRTYLPRLDALYQITAVDLPGAEDKATDRKAQRDYVDLDVTDGPQ